MINKWASFSYMLQMMRQQIWMLKQMTVAADWVDQPGTEASRRWETLNREIIKVVRSEKDSPLSLLFPPISGLRNKALAYRQRLLAARLALRVVRYRAREQSLPEDLAAVLDAGLPHVPCSLWDGSGPNLKVRPSGFTVSYATPEGEEELNASVAVSFPASGDTSKASPASNQ